MRTQIAERLFAAYLKEEDLRHKSIIELVEMIRVKTHHDIPLLRVEEIVKEVRGENYDGIK